MNKILSKMKYPAIGLAGLVLMAAGSVSALAENPTEQNYSPDSAQMAPPAGDADLTLFPPHPGERPRTFNQDCESDGNQTKVCPINAFIVDVELIDRRSSDPCDEGREWGWSARSIWVTQGCRAIFRVTTR
jgi:hypothetical protein